MTNRPSVLILLLLCVLSDAWSQEPPEPGPVHDLSDAEVWAVNHFRQLVSLSFTIEDAQWMWRQSADPDWTLAVNPGYGVNPTLVRVTKADGKITAQRKKSAGESFWEAAVSARRADPSATAETIAERLTFTLSDYDQDSCPSLIDLGARFESLTFGPITKVVTATGGQFYRYRADFAPGHWIEGRLFGTGWVDRNFNPPLANWIEELSSALDECDRRRLRAQALEPLREGDREEWMIKGEKFVFRWVPPGEIRVGSPEDEPGRTPDEEQYTFRFSTGFWMQETEVTQGQWEAIIGSPNPSGFPCCGPRCPVENVDWHQARAFCAELARVTGSPYRLPSEAEWEYAARAGSVLPFGRPCPDYGSGTDSIMAPCLDRIGWYWGNSGGRTREACEAPVEANAWGLCDMLGNVWEWVEDAYVPSDRYATDVVIDPKAVEKGSGRVLRGGSWAYDPTSMQIASRFDNKPGYRNNETGFRCVRETE